MSESVLREKAKEFAKNIVFITREIKSNNKESVLTNQLVRSGTSVGANIREAFYGHGTADFVAKLKVALKEASETQYWLRLLCETEYISNQAFQSLHNDLVEILKILTAICKHYPQNNQL